MSGDESITTLILSVSLREAVEDGEDVGLTPLLYALSDTAEDYGVVELHVIGIRRGDPMEFLPDEDDGSEDSGLDDEGDGKVSAGSGE